MRDYFLHVNVISDVYFDPFPFFKGSKGEYIKDTFFPNHGLSSKVSLRQMCKAIRRRLQSSFLFLYPPVLLHGICSINIQRKPSRYRSLSQCHAQQTLPYRPPRPNRTQYIGRCKRTTRLANIRRLRPSSCQHSPTIYAFRFFLGHIFESTKLQ
jgi:hypothetical protein